MSKHNYVLFVSCRNALVPLHSLARMLFSDWLVDKGFEVMLETRENRCECKLRKGK